jgi:hypothetical protein
MVHTQQSTVHCTAAALYAVYSTVGTQGRKGHCIVALISSAKPDLQVEVVI